MSAEKYMTTTRSTDTRNKSTVLEGARAIQDGASNACGPRVAMISMFEQKSEKYFYEIIFMDHLGLRV